MAQRTAGSVLELWRYPVSSLAGESLDAADVSTAGFFGDRLGAFFEVATGEIVNPSLFRRWNIAPNVSSRLTDSGDIELSFDDEHWISIAGPSCAAHLAQFFGSEMQFKRYGGTLPTGTANQRYAWKPVHLVSRQSMEILGKLLPESNIDARRFRPNIVVDFPDPPGDMPELLLIDQEFEVGCVRLRGTMATGRCSFTTLRQHNLPDDKAVLRALIRGYEKNFGIYCEVLSSGTVAVGDALSTSAELRSPSRESEFGIATGVNLPSTTANGQPTRIRHRVDNPSDLAEDGIYRLEVDGIGLVAFVRDQGRIFAVSDQCPHAKASLSQGFIEGGRIVCPVHFAEFDLETGQAFNEPPGCKNLKCFRIEKVGEDIFILG